MEKTAVGRTFEQIDASLQMNMTDMVNRAIAIGQDLSDMKALLGHGKFLPYLKERGISSSTASNYMKVAKEIAPGSRLAGLPYSKALALLSAPADEREELAEQADEKSAAEIRRLIEERNRAAEAANTETARADQAEADAKMFNQENAGLRVKIQNLEARIRDDSKTHDAQCREIKKAWEAFHEEKERAEKLRADLLTAENNRVEVEVAPADYQDMKKRQEELLNAAAEAEERAAAAEAEVDRLRSEGFGQTEEPWKVMKVALTRFMADCEMLVLDPQGLVRDQAKIEAYLSRLEGWTDQMRIAMAKAVPAEGAVV